MRDFERVVKSLFDDPTYKSFSTSSKLHTFSEVKDDDGVLYVDLPGVSKEDVMLQYQPPTKLNEFGKLAIAAKRTVGGTKDIETEIFVNALFDWDGVKATMKDGVLTLKVKKREDGAGKLKSIKIE